MPAKARYSLFAQLHLRRVESILLSENHRNSPPVVGRNIVSHPRGSEDTVPSSRVPLAGCGSISDSHSLTHSAESRRHALSGIHRCGRTPPHFRPLHLPANNRPSSHLLSTPH